MKLIEIDHPTWKHITLVDKRQTPGHPFCEPLKKRIRACKANKQRIMIIGTKAHFSSGSICKDCGTIPRCTHCDVAISRHKDSHQQQFGLCHLCKTYYPTQTTCAHCHGHNFDTFGFWLQALEAYLKQELQMDALIVEQNVANSLPKIKKLETLLHENNVILSTWLLTEPPKDLPIDLVIVLHADLWLQSPDLYSSWRNFCFLSEILTKYSCKEFWLHTYNPDHPSIQYATTGNAEAMEIWEHQQRKQFWYPPYTELCVLLYKHEIENRLYSSVNKLYQELLFLKSTYSYDELEIYTTPPLIYKAFGKYRYNIIMKSPRLRAFMDIVYSKLQMRSRWFRVDWDPQNII